MDHPFDSGYAGVIGGRFQAAIQQTWEREGLIAHQFRPIVRPLPTVPISGATYSNHPTLFHYIVRFFVYHFGLSEFILRIYPALGAAFSMALLAFLGARLWGSLGAGVIVALQLAAPGLLYYGVAVNYESTVTALMLGALIVSEIGSKRLAGMGGFLLSFLASSHDWAGGLVVVGLLGRMLYKKHMQWAILLKSGAGIALSLVLHFVLVVYWEGGVEGAVASLKAASGSADLSQMVISRWQFLKNQFRFFGTMWGWCGLFLVFLPFLPKRWLFPGIEKVRVQVATWLPIQVVWVLLFTGRSYDHEFWSYCAHPGVMLVQTGVLVAFLEGEWGVWGRSRLRYVVLLSVALGLLFPLVQRISDIKNDKTKKDLRVVQGFVTETDFVMTTHWTGHWYFYLKCAIWDDWIDDQERDRLIQMFREGQFPQARRFLIVVYDNARIHRDKQPGDFLKANPDFQFIRTPLADFYSLSR